MSILEFDPVQVNESKGTTSMF